MEKTCFKQLQERVAIERENLGDTFADLLLATPYMPQVPGYRLLTMGLEIWPNTEDVQHQVPDRPPISKMVKDLLDLIVQCGGHISLWSSEDIVAINGPLTDILIVKPMWTVVYLAIAAWYEEHKPLFEPIELPANPAERLEVLCKLIEQDDPSGLNVPLLLATLDALGVPGEFGGYQILPADGTRQMTFKRTLVLNNAANNSTTSLLGPPNTMYYRLGLATFVVENMSESFTLVCRALSARQHRHRFPICDQ